MTSTDAQGVVHELDGQRTLCGQDATFWSKAITAAQLAGMVIYCHACREAS